MWTAATRAQHSRDKLRFASDVTDAEWAVVAPLLPPGSRSGGPEMATAGDRQPHLYVLRCGVPGGLPPCLPPRQTVYGWFAAWRDAGIWQQLNRHLVMQSRGAGVSARPTAMPRSSTIRPSCQTACR